MNDEIQITIALSNKQQVDIAVSASIKLGNLLEQLCSIYGLEKRPYTVIVQTKNRVIRSDQTLKELKITTGDILQLTEDLNGQSVN